MKQLDWITTYATEYQDALSMVENEIYLKEEKAAIEKARQIGDITPNQELTLSEWQKELESMDLEWWHWERTHHRLAAKEPAGRWVRDFKKNIGSAMASKEAQHYCKMRGGCCARNCGCCQRERKTNRPKTAQLKQYMGHCTRKCGCCTRYNQLIGVTAKDSEQADKKIGFDVFRYFPVYPFHRESRTIEKRNGMTWEQFKEEAEAEAEEEAERRRKKKKTKKTKTSIR